MFILSSWDTELGHFFWFYAVLLFVFCTMIYNNIIKNMFKTTVSKYDESHIGRNIVWMLSLLITLLFVFGLSLFLFDSILKQSILNKYWYAIIPITQLILTILIVDIIRFNYKNIFKKTFNFFASTKKNIFYQKVEIYVNSISNFFKPKPKHQSSKSSHKSSSNSNKKSSKSNKKGGKRK